MSWSATLFDDRGHIEGEWNFTHNCNGMINTILDSEYEQVSVAEEVFRFKTTERQPTWWKQLDDLDGEQSWVFLDTIIAGLESDPERFRKMNPENGWGDFDSLVKVLKAMREAIPNSWPSRWRVSG